MGLQDRDYYRQDSPAERMWGGSTSACKTLIAINVGVYVLQLLTIHSAQGGATGWFELTAVDVLQRFQIWRLVTSAFCHSPFSLWHLIFNMLGLWIFGNLVEAVYGAREFIRFYLTAAVVSALGFLIVELIVNHFAVRQIPPELGASGAVMGVMMLCAFHYPHLKIYVFFVIPLELRWLAAGAVVLDLYPVLRELGGNHVYDNVAHATHLAGLLYGFLYKVLNLQYTRLFTGSRWQDWKRNFRLATRKRPKSVKIYQPPSETSESSSGRADLDRRVDEILAKISTQGEASLTDSERDILKEASRRYRKH